MGSQRRRYSSDIDDQILALQAQGLPRAEIAEKLSVPITKVHKLLSKRGAKLSPEQRSAIATAARAKTLPEYPIDIHEKIDVLRRAGMPMPQIAKELGVTIGKVYVEAVARSDYRLTAEQRSALHRSSTTVKSSLSQKPIISDSDEEALERERLAGATIRSLAKARNVSRSTIKAILRRRGVTLPAEQRQANAQAGRTPEQKERFVAAGQSEATIAKRKATMRAKEYSESYRQSVQGRVKAWWRSMTEEERTTYLARRKSAFNASPAVAAHTTRMKESTGDQALFLLSLLDQEGFATATERCKAWAAERGGEFVGPYVLSGLAAEWRCKDGHTFRSRPNNVQQGGWCPACACGGPSRQQREIFEFVRGIAPDVILDDKTIIRPKELDVWVPSARLAVEFHGLYWHSSAAPGYSPGATMRKAQLCQRVGARLLVVFEDEWRDKRALVEAMIAYRLGRSERKLDARKLDRKEVRPTEAASFFDANHLAGAVRAERAVGLYDGTELMACASFRRSFVDGSPEVARLATKTGVAVRGAAGRLLSEEAYPGSLYSYSDSRLSTGEVYRQLGWEEVPVANRPGYWYVDDKFDRRLDRFSCRKSEALLEIGTTETEQNFAQGRHRIEDAGIRKWQRPIKATCPV